MINSLTKKYHGTCNQPENQDGATTMNARSENQQYMDSLNNKQVHTYNTQENQNGKCPHNGFLKINCNTNLIMEGSW